MPKVNYEEGDWFAVPLHGGGYAAGVIARANPRAGLLGYFFASKYPDVVRGDLRDAGKEIRRH